MGKERTVVNVSKLEYMVEGQDGQILENGGGTRGMGIGEEERRGVEIYKYILDRVKGQTVLEDTRPVKNIKLFIYLFLQINN